MILAGFETTDPISGTRAVVIESPQDTQNLGWVLELHCPIGAGPVIQEHIHFTWTETFEIVQGSAKYKLDGKEYTIGAGEQVVMPPNQAHTHPWNNGDQVMIYRQISRFPQPSPDALNDVLGSIATINGFAREGKLNAQGLPKDLLQLAIILRTLGKYGNYSAQLPIGLQRFISATLGLLAELLGYRAVYPRYINPPAALGSAASND
jgi:hypothetical protein